MILSLGYPLKSTREILYLLTPRLQPMLIASKSLVLNIRQIYFFKFHQAVLVVEKHGLGQKVSCPFNLLGHRVNYTVVNEASGVLLENRCPRKLW